MRLQPDTPQSGVGIAKRPSPAPTSPSGADEMQVKHLHPALLAVLQKRIAQATAGHPGVPFH